MDRTLLPVAILIGGFITTVLPAQAQTIDLSKLAPFCEAPFKMNAAGACEADLAALALIKSPEKCTAPGTKWDGLGKTCSAVVGKEPDPTCGNDLPDLAVKDKKCVVQRSTQRSSSGDFVGDCFKVHSTPPDDTFGLTAPSYWKVESQTRLPNDDKELVISPALPQPGLFIGLTVWCSSIDGSVERRLPASVLIKSGAHRYGWAYGVLTMPFKYYRKDKSFSPGALNIGPYLGRRWGSAGSAITAAAAFSVGSVRGEVRDASGNITDTPDLTALSVALGLMLDVSKSPELKPFKVGLFVGQDRVNGGDAVKFRYNRRGWVAFQIGYDFTDNR